MISAWIEGVWNWIASNPGGVMSVIFLGVVCFILMASWWDTEEKVWGKQWKVGIWGKINIFFQSWSRPNIYAVRYDENYRIVGVWRSNAPKKGFPATVPGARVVPTDFLGWLRAKRKIRNDFR